MAGTPHELRSVSLAELDEATLERFYGLMEAAFPPPELVTYDELAEALTDEATISGTVLLDGDEPVAGMVTERYVGGRVVLLGYLVVAPAARGTGLGSRLLAELAALPAPPEGGEPPLVVAEIEDPRFHPSGHQADPVVRVRFYDGAGARLLPLDYAQPSLRPGSPRVENLLLIALGTVAGDLDGRLVAEFLEEYYAACEGEYAVRSDPAFAALRDAARGDERGRLALHPLAELDAARPGKPRRGRTAELRP